MNNKVELLRKAAKKILNPRNNYNWNDAAFCNCGWVVRVIKPEIDKIVDICWNFGTYSEKANECKVTGLNDNVVINILLNVGFTPDEIIEIEDYKEHFNYKFNDAETNRENAANHLLSIANRLELATKVKTKDHQIQTVSVSC